MHETTLEMRAIKIVVEKHADGYMAYPLGVKRVLVGQGDMYDETLADVTSALDFHIETFGPSISACISDASSVNDVATKGLPNA